MIDDAKNRPFGAVFRPVGEAHAASSTADIYATYDAPANKGVGVGFLHNANEFMPWYPLKFRISANDLEVG
jgi:hypothetical protein